MKKLNCLLSILLIGALIAGCSNEDIVKNGQDDAGVIKVHITEGSDARAELGETEDGKSITLNWKDGDDIHLIFKQSVATIVGQSAKVHKEADGGGWFEFEIPEGISHNTKFDLFATYGGVSVDQTNGYVNIAKHEDATSTDLKDLENNNAVIVSGSTQIKPNQEEATIKLDHIGTMVKVTVRNITSNALDISDVELAAEDNFPTNLSDNENGFKFDPVSKTILPHATGVNSIPLTTQATTLESVETVTYLTWISLIDKDSNGDSIVFGWPEFILNIDGKSTSTKEGKTDFVSESIGKITNIFATYNGVKAEFATREDMDAEIEEDTFIDTRDGNLYKMVTIGEQTWMAENLKYLPEVVGPKTGSTRSSYYYVYGYDGTDVEAAKATENYQIYGVLYNWLAAMAGSQSSDANPSNVQGICPEGWHLPSLSEWDELMNYLGGKDEAGGKMKHTDFWKDPNKGATNESGFSGLPGGFRCNIGNFNSFSGEGNWWISTEYNASHANYQYLFYSHGRLVREQGNKEFAFSVRCVKD